MKKRYQIQSQRAVQRLRRLAEQDNPTIQMMLPLAQIVGLLQAGLGHLLREAGLLLMKEIMEAEVRDVVGQRSQPNPERQAYRWGQEDGYCVVDGQKVPTQHPRVRSPENGEIPLGSYTLFRRSPAMEESVWGKMLLGLSTRNYGEVVKEFTKAYGVGKSATSEHFVSASREKLKELMERKLDALRLCVILIDGTEYHKQHFIVALGIGEEGRKTVLGLRQGASENATVVNELLTDLLERGVDFCLPRLYVLDGAGALHKAVKQHAGERGFIQRCQVHKIRNVLRHLPQEHQGSVKRQLDNAYGMGEYGEAKRALERLHRELMDLNPSAARSLAEGMEETLTVHKLRVPELLRKSVSSTNVIESAFSVGEGLCGRVKRWRAGDHLLRWVASGLLLAERKFRRVKGYRQIRQLVEAMANELSKKGVAKQRAVA